MPCSQKGKIMNRNSVVDVWFADYDNPMKDVVQAVRETILAADPRIEETIKWKAPTFVYRGNLASFFPKAKKHASLMFHKGAFIPGEFPNLEAGGKISPQAVFQRLCARAAG